MIRRVVFQVGETEYSWQDVLLAAALWGRWEEIVRQAKLGVAAMRQAEDAESPPVTDEDVEAAADEFRYSRNLLTAEEMEAWLATWELDVDDWMTWVVSDQLRRVMAAQDAPVEPEVAPEDLETATWAEAVFSGTLLRIAFSLADKVAVAERMREASGPGENEERLPAAGIPFEATPELLRSVDGLGLDVPRDEVRQKLAFLAGLDRAYADFRASVLTEANLVSRMKVRQTDWARVKARMIRFASEDAALEALISIRDDGTGMEEVASDAAAELVEGTFFLEAFETAVRDHLLSAPSGALLGPLKSGDEWVLYSVESKQLATLDDAEIRERAEKDLLTSLVGREVDNRISWRWGR